MSAVSRNPAGWRSRAVKSEAAEQRRCAQRARPVRPQSLGTPADGAAAPRLHEQDQAERRADQPQPEGKEAGARARAHPSARSRRRSPSPPRRPRTGTRARLVRRRDATPLASSPRGPSSPRQVTRFAAGPGPALQDAGCSYRAAFHPCIARLSKPFALGGRRPRAPRAVERTAYHAAPPGSGESLSVRSGQRHGTSRSRHGIRPSDQERPPRRRHRRAGAARRRCGARGRIAEIGRINEPAARAIDAADCVVAPGFIDPHTHYDAQICWDRAVTSSPWHGVTSVVMGNCGVGIAPCRPAEREVAMRDLVNVEAIPFEVLEAGITWDWETFPEYHGGRRAAPPVAEPRVPRAAHAVPPLRDGRSVDGARGHAGRDAAASQRSSGRRWMPAHSGSPAPCSISTSASAGGRWPAATRAATSTARMRTS